MIKRIKDLEKTSRLLEPSAADRKGARKKVIAYTETFLKDIEKLNAFIATSDKGAGLLEAPISEEPISVDEAISLVKNHVDRPGLNPASGGHLGYIPGGGIYYSALGDYMADVSNRYAGISFASPGAVHMENMLIEWSAQVVGYPTGCGGNLASGGSIANLIAVVTARDAYQLKGKDLDKTVIYLSEQAHHCIDKAIRIAGLKECIKRFIPLDKDYRMMVPELEEAIQQDKAAGLIPWLIIATAGTTDVGAIDPLDAIGDIAKKYRLWYHIDGAYGAYFMLAEESRKKLKGIEKSDSVVMDPHKNLFLPYGLGIVLVKDKRKLYESHYFNANYMQEAHHVNEAFSPSELSPELTKHFRGLRLWLPLKLFGVKPFRAALEEKLLLTQYLYEEIKKRGFEMGPYPALSVITYRYVPADPNRDANTFNQLLIREIQKDGKIFISSTQLKGKFVLRAAILSFRTHLKTVNLFLKVLDEKVKEVEAMK